MGLIVEDAPANERVYNYEKVKFREPSEGCDGWVDMFATAPTGSGTSIVCVTYEQARTLMYALQGYFGSHRRESLSERVYGEG